MTRRFDYQLAGPNEAGKTSLLDAISNVIARDYLEGVSKDHIKSNPEYLSKVREDRLKTGDTLPTGDNVETIILSIGNKKFQFTDMEGEAYRQIDVNQNGLIIVVDGDEVRKQKENGPEKHLGKCLEILRTLSNKMDDIKDTFKIIIIAVTKSDLWNPRRAGGIEQRILDHVKNELSVSLSVMSRDHNCRIGFRQISIYRDYEIKRFIEFLYR